MHQTDVTMQENGDATDRSAVLMMLTYLEEECRRLGSAEASRHVALAAMLMQRAMASTLCEGPLTALMPRPLQ